jgi:hypothetical protein
MGSPRSTSAPLQVPAKGPTSLPLEAFDCPELEAFRPAERLAAARTAGAAGLGARSRYFDPRGAFVWAPCVAVEHDG